MRVWNWSRQFNILHLFILSLRAIWSNILIILFKSSHVSMGLISVCLSIYPSMTWQLLTAQIFFFYEKNWIIKVISCLKKMKLELLIVMSCSLNSTKFQVCNMVSSGDLMNSNVMTANITALNTWNLPRQFIIRCPHHRRKEGRGSVCSGGLIVGVTSQGTCISKHGVMCFKYTQFYLSTVCQ